jgi:hypothetical protein
VKAEKTSITRQRLGKQVSMATVTQARIEDFLGRCFLFGLCETAKKASELALSWQSGYEEKTLRVL